jgi:hypothetical protein
MYLVLDQYLILGISDGLRPEINEPEAPKCYIDLMKKCWDSNPGNRPNVTEIKELIKLFGDSCNINSRFARNGKKFINKNRGKLYIANISLLFYSNRTIFMSLIA